MDQLAVIFSQIFTVTTLRYFLLAGIPFLVFYLLLPSRFQKRKIQPGKASRKDFRREILQSVLSSAVFTAIAVAVLYSPLRAYTLIYDDIHSYPTWYIGVSLALSLIVHDTYFYWMHRLLHNKKLFRWTHLTHHKSVNPSPWTSYSFHFLEAITEGLIVLIIAVVMPLHPLTVILFTIASFIINVYGHLGYEIMPRWIRRTWLFGIINTSVHHNLHHRKFDGNYGLYFRTWDRLMGTEHPDYVKEYDRIQAQRDNTSEHATESNHIET